MSNNAALVLVIGEPFTVEHKDLILDKIVTELSSWDVEAAGFDLGEELQDFTATDTEERPNGERVLIYDTPKLLSTVLFNPQLSTVTTALRRVLATPSLQYRHVVYVGHTFSGSGHWLLQDDAYSAERFLRAFRDASVDAALKAEPRSTLAVSVVLSDGDWKQGYLAKQEELKHVDVKFNPGPKGDVQSEGLRDFAEQLSTYANPRTNDALLQASDVVGNIRFNRPTMYIFPGSQGNSALFGISGFNLLVDGGYGRRPCFWDFTRHLDRIDAMLLTNLGENNLQGISSVLDRKLQNDVHPEIGFVYFNGIEARGSLKHSSNGDLNHENGGSHKEASLIVSLMDEGKRLCESLVQLGHTPHPVHASLTPINLYHKVGHGSLDMYVLNPAGDNKELKEFLSQWKQGAGSFSVNKAGVPLPHSVSVSSLVVWRPAAPNEAITRILFPGAAPYSKLAEGLDRLKSMDIFQHASVSISSLLASKTKKPLAAGAGAKAARGVKPPAPSSVREAKPSPAREPKPSTPAREPKAATPAREPKTATPAREPKTATPAREPKTATPAREPKTTTTPARDAKKPAPEKKTPTAKPTGRSTPTRAAATAPSPAASKPAKDAKNVKKAAGIKKAGSGASSKSSSKDPTPIATPTEAAAAAAAMLDLSQAVPEPVPEPVMPEAFNEQEAAAADATEETIPKAVVESSPPEPVREPTPEPPREPTPEPPREPTPEPPREPTPEPPREPTPEPPREPTPEPPREPTPEPPREPTPEPVREPTPEPPREPTPEPVKEATPEPAFSPPAGVPEPIFDLSDELSLQADPSFPIEPTPASMAPQQAWGAEEELLVAQAPVPPQESPVPQESPAPSQEAAFPEADLVAEPAAESEMEFDPFAAPPASAQNLPDSGDSANANAMPPPDKPFSAFDEFAFEKDVDTASAGVDDINANAASMNKELQQSDAGRLGEGDHGPPAPGNTDVFGGISPEGLPSPPEPTPGFDDDEDRDSLEGEEERFPMQQQQQQPDLLPEQAMSKEMMEDLGIFEGDNDAAAPSDLLSGGFPAMAAEQYPPVNPFVGIDEASIPSDNAAAPPRAKDGNVERDSLEREFDPLKEWGQPDALPAPIPPSEASAAPKKADDKKAGPRNGPSAGARAAGAKKPDSAASKKPASAAAKTSSTARKPLSATAPAARKAPASAGAKKENGAKNGAKPEASAAAKKTLSATTAARKVRPAASAPAKSAPAAKASAGAAAANKRATASATASSRSAPAPAKSTPVTPFYVDLTYIPINADIDFFRRVRARQYVLSALEPCPKQLNALLEAKGTWEDSEAEVTIIPTYDTEDLRRWMAIQREELATAKVDVAPSASRCTIQLQDHHTSCSAYRLEF